MPRTIYDPYGTGTINRVPLQKPNQRGTVYTGRPETTTSPNSTSVPQSGQGFKQPPMQLNAQFNPEEAKYLSFMANSGGVGKSDLYGNQLLGRINGKGPMSAAEVAAGFDAKIKSMQERGMSFDPVALAQEKQAAILQFQAEETLANQKMQAERDKQAKAVATAQGSMQDRAKARIAGRPSQQAKAGTTPTGTPLVAGATATSPVTPPATPQATTPPSPSPTTTEGTTTTADAGTSGATSSTASPTTTGSGMALSQLPPEFQALAPFLQQFFEQNEELQKQNESFAQKQLDLLNKGNETIEQKMQAIENSYKESSAAMQGLLETAKKSQEENLAKQQKAEQDRLNWQGDELLRKLGKQKVQAHDEMVAQIALSGGFGQDAGMKAVRESDAEFETQMQNLTIEMGYARTDLNAKYSALYQENTNNYVDKTMQNMKDLRSSLERIGMQGIQNVQARQQAEQSILSKAWETQVKLRESRADKNLEIAKDIQTWINQARDDKRAQEQLGWQRLEWAVQTYGTNAPASLLESISKQLPGTDVSGIAKSMTLSEMKERRLGGGGGGYSLFSLSEKNPATGKPLTFEQYLTQKEQEAGQTFSSDKRKLLQAEYALKTANNSRLSSQDIIMKFKRKAVNGGLTGPDRKYAEAQLSEYLKNGNLEEANALVDSVGDPPNATERTQWSKAKIVRNNLVEMKQLFDEIGQSGPISGRMRNFNPYDARAQKLQRLLTSTVPSIARALGETGPLSDSDRKIYTDILPNLNLPADQIYTAVDDLLNRTNMAMEMQLNTWEDSSLSTYNYRREYEQSADSTFDQYASSLYR